jgi:hypothetical protein
VIPTESEVTFHRHPALPAEPNRLTAATPRSPASVTGANFSETAASFISAVSLLSTDII